MPRGWILRFAQTSEFLTSFVCFLLPFYLTPSSHKDGELEALSTYLIENSSSGHFDPNLQLQSTPHGNFDPLFTLTAYTPNNSSSLPSYYIAQPLQRILQRPGASVHSSCIFQILRHSFYASLVHRLSFKAYSTSSSSACAASSFRAVLGDHTKIEVLRVYLAKCFYSTILPSPPPFNHVTPGRVEYELNLAGLRTYPSEWRRWSAHLLSLGGQTQGKVGP